MVFLGNKDSFSSSPASFNYATCRLGKSKTLLFFLCMVIMFLLALKLCILMFGVSFLLFLMISIVILWYLSMIIIDLLGFTFFVLKLLFFKNLLCLLRHSSVFISKPYASTQGRNTCLIPFRLIFNIKGLFPAFLSLYPSTK